MRFKRAWQAGRFLLAFAAALPVLAHAAAPPQPTFRGGYPLDGTIEFYWLLPPNTTVTKHQLRYKTTLDGDYPIQWMDFPMSLVSCGREGGGRLPRSECTSTGNSALIYWAHLRGLPNGQRYHVQLRAVNEDGFGEPVYWQTALAADRDAIVEFPDPVFKARMNTAVRVFCPAPGGCWREPGADLSEVTQYEMSRTGIFIFWDPGRIRTRENRITSLEGLQYAVNLGRMDIGHHSVTDISPVADLLSMYSFGYNGSLISDVSPLQNLINMEWLFLNRAIINDDVDCASNPTARACTVPEGFDPSQGVITDLTSLRNLRKLERLYICDQRVPPEHLAPFTNMDELSYCRNNLTDISPLRNMTKMLELYIYENNIKDVSPLATMTDMEMLQLTGNRISDVAPLRTLRKAKHIYLSDNPLNAGRCSDGVRTTRATCAGAGGVWTSTVVDTLSPLVTAGALQLIDLRGETHVSERDVDALRALTPTPTVLWDGDIRPVTPRSLAVAGGAGGQLTMTWDDPRNRHLAAYEYRHRPSDGGPWSDWTMSVKAPVGAFHSWRRDRPDRTELSLTGLADGTYDFELRALIGSDHFGYVRTFESDGTTPAALRDWGPAVTATGILITGADSDARHVVNWWEVGRIFTPGPAARVESVAVRATPPTAGETPMPEALQGEALRLPLTSLVSAPFPRELLWTVRSSDESVATVYVDGNELVVEPAFAAEGMAEIEVTATDVLDQSVTVTFEVHVEFFMSKRPAWRLVPAVMPEETMSEEMMHEE